MTDQKLPGRPGNHKRFVALFDYYLGGVYPPDGANRTDTGRRKLGECLAEGFRQRSAKTLLDCAAGTGCPSLDVLQNFPEEFQIHCCDGDEGMVAILAERAAASGLDPASMAPPRRMSRSRTNGQDPMVINWLDLDNLTGTYDYVLCRGNSLVYAETWAGGARVASKETIRNHMERMARRVKPGGYLHVDAPITDELDETRRSILDTDSRSMVEEVTVDGDRRRWTVTFQRGEQEPVYFKRWSSRLTINELQVVLDDLGFEETNPIELEAERPNFGVIIARKPV